MVRFYELLLIAKSELEEEALDNLIERIGSIVTSRDGSVVNIDKWGKRRLAFEVQDNTEGFYMVINIEADNAAITELNRVLKITDEVVRYLLIRKEKVDEGVETSAE